MVVAAAGAAYWLRGDGGGDGASSPTKQESAVEVLGEAGRTEDGLPVRAPVRLTHPDGAVAEVPASPYLFSDWLDIRRVDVGEMGAGWEAHGSGWQFASRAGVTASGPIHVTIPDAGSGADGRVVALTALGGWAEVHTTHESGTFVFDISDVPAPWLVTVATTRDVKYLEGDGPGEASKVEALYWSDRDAWQRQELAWLADQDLTVATAVEPRMVSVVAAPLATYQDVKKDLDWALRMLGGARATQAAGGILLPGMVSSTASVAQYQAGIARLTAVRTTWVNGRYRMAREEGSEGDLTALRYDESQTMDQAIESALALYAPWGVELTNHLLRSGYLASMDLRVLAPYGQAYFTDVKLPAGAVDVVDKELAGVELAGHRKEERFLRLYSTLAVSDTSIIDYLKDWKTEAFMRYLPIVLWQAGLIAGGPLLIGFTVADQLLDWYQDTEATAGDAYFYNQMQDYGVALQTANLVVDSTMDLVRTTYVAGATPGSQALGVAQLVYAMGLTYAIANTDWYLLKDVREVTEGSQAYCIQGQCNRVYAQNIPAIQVVASARGDAALPKGAYPATRTRVMTWSMGFKGGDVRLEGNRPVYSPNLHEIFHAESGSSELWAQASSGYTGKEALNALVWEPYVEARWPDGLLHSTPDAQAIRVRIPKTYLEGIEKEFTMPPGSPLKDYGLVLRIEGSDGARNLFELTEPAKARAGDDKNSVYFSVVLTRDDSVSTDGIDEPYAGAAQVAEMQPLRRSLNGRIAAQSQDEDDWIEFPIEFTGKNPIRQLDKEDFESPRIQFLDVSAEQKPVVYRGTTTQGLAIEIVVDFKAKTWEIQKLEMHTPQAVCGDPNSDDLFEGGTRSENSSEWGAVRKAAKAIAPGSEDYVQALSLLWLTGGNLEGNVLAWAPAPPEVAANAKEGESPASEIREMWGAEAFGTLDSTKRTISGELVVPFSDWFGCPAERFSYTADKVAP